MPKVLANSIDSHHLSATAESICPSDLETFINPIIQRPEYERSHWGILIQTLNSDHTLYHLNAEKYFIPASNVKLLTSAAILLQFGSNYRIHTPVYATGTPPLLETLHLVGKGDPTITTEKLRELARQLKQKGVRQINQLIVEDSYFSQRGIQPSWEWEDIFYDYAVPVSSLVLNENAVTLSFSPQQLGQPLKFSWSDLIAARQWNIDNQTTTATKDSSNTLTLQGFLGTSQLILSGQLPINIQEETLGLSIPNPTQYFLESFMQILNDEGINIQRNQVTTQPLKNNLGKEIVFIQSESLSQLLLKLNQDSNNLIAETLLQLLENTSNSRNSKEVLQERLTELGVDSEGYHLVDGSGLSRHNWVSPETFVQTLQLMNQTPHAEVYKNSLAVAGVSGTLKRRFENTNIKGYLYGKTGTMTGAISLSGYLYTSNYEPLVFSIIINNNSRTATDLRKAIDEIVLLLGKLKQC